jgi:predicted Zn-dependent peptidase
MLDVSVRRSTLPNGLPVVVIPQPHLHRTHVALWVRIGSRFETAESNGLSHFLEHMLYRGTPTLPNAHAVNLAFEEVGGYLHAVTHTDNGVFSVTLPPENLEATFRLFSETLLRPTFADIEIEKGIVCEEILEDLDDEGRQVDADNISRGLIYPSHPLGFTITGDERRVRSFTEPALRAHHDRHYVASGAVLVVAGAVEPERAEALAAASFGTMPRGERVASPAPVHAQRKARHKLVPNASSQTELRMCLRAIPELDPARDALDVLMRVIDDGMSTRLYHRICDAQGLCYDVSAGYDGYEDDGVVDFAAGVQHARTARVTSEILAMIDELASEGPTDDELDKVKRRTSWELSAVRDSPEELATFFGLSGLLGRDDSPAAREARVRAIGRDEVIDVARRIARPERLNVVAVGLLEKDEEAKLADVVRGWRGA